MIYLAGDSAPTGVIVSAGAGVYAKAEIVEAKGAYLGDSPTAEDIASHWGEISDMSGASAHFMGGEQTGKFFEMAAGDWIRPIGEKFSPLKQSVNQSSSSKFNQLCEAEVKVCAAYSQSRTGCCGEKRGS